MSQAQNKAVVRRWFEDVWNKGDLDAIDDLVAEDSVFIDPVSGEHRGPQGIREMVSMYRTAFPDTHFDIEEQVAEGDRVMTRWNARGTHQGELMGISPTGKEISITGMEIDRVSEGRLAGGSVNWDALGMFRQLGVVPETIGAKT